MKAFKSYDIRGTFGTDITETLAYQVGRCLPHLLHAKRVLIGRDTRLSSPCLREALVRGLVEAGATVDDLGLATTPMVYFFTAEKHYDASVQITASHNPPTDNGLKISKSGALPVGYDAGLKTIEQWIIAGTLPPKAVQPGTVQTVDYRPDYLAWLQAHKPNCQGVRFAVDCSDGMGAIIAHELFGPEAIYINDTPDGHFPHHAPNPLEVKNCQQLIDLVREQHLDMGIIFDGDADRVMFIDNQGHFIQPDFLIPLIAEALAPAETALPITVIHDIRTSRGVIEYLQEAGFKTAMGKVGHAYAKLLLRETHALCGGELAGHYYFRDFHFCDSGEWAALIVLGIVAQAKRAGHTFAQLLDPIRTRYINSGEINLRDIPDRATAIAAIETALIKTFGKPVTRVDFDGIRLEWNEGWVNVRGSNTEPLLRLLAEARTQALLEAFIRVCYVALGRQV